MARYVILRIAEEVTQALNISLNQHLIPWARVGEPRTDTQDLATGTKLWAWLEDQVKDM